MTRLNTKKAAVARLRRPKLVALPPRSWLLEAIHTALENVGLTTSLNAIHVLRQKVGKPLSSARAKYTTKGTVVNFFELLERHVREKNIITANIANMDKNGLQEGETVQGRVLGTALTGRTYKAASDAST